VNDFRSVCAGLRSSKPKRSQCNEDLRRAEVADILADPDVRAGLGFSPSAVENHLCRPDPGGVRRRSIAHHRGQRGDRFLRQTAGHFLDVLGDFHPTGRIGGLAEFERDLIRMRTGEGHARAKARGVKLGRKPKLTEHQKREAIRRRDRDGEPMREIARSYNVSHSTISRLSP